MIRLIADTREKATVKAVKSYHTHIEWMMLKSADYACSDFCCGFERKEKDLDNMTQVLIQVTELQQSYQNAYLVVNVDPTKWVNAGGSRAYPARRAFLASLAVRGMQPIYESNYHQMLDTMHQIISKNHDSKMRGRGEFNHVRHVTKKDAALNILTAIPGIGPKKAQSILDKFGSVGNFINADEEDIKSIEGISIKTCDQILDALYDEHE